jgi:hypothetical protein
VVFEGSVDIEFDDGSGRDLGVFDGFAGKLPESAGGDRRGPGVLLTGGGQYRRDVASRSGL